MRKTNERLVAIDEMRARFASALSTLHHSKISRYGTTVGQTNADAVHCPFGRRPGRNVKAAPAIHRLRVINSLHRLELATAPARRNTAARIPGKRNIFTPQALTHADLYGIAPTSGDVFAAPQPFENLIGAAQ